MVDGFFDRRANASVLDLSNAEIREMFRELKSSIDNNNKEDNTRLTKNEKLVEDMTGNINRRMENFNRILPRIGDIESRLNSIEGKLDTIPNIGNKLENIEDVEQALPRISDLEDRLVQVEKKIEENYKLREQVEELLEARFREEYKRKRDNVIVYGPPGKEVPGKSILVAKAFLYEDLKMEYDWVDKVQIKSATRLQSNGEASAPLKICFFNPHHRDACLRNGKNLNGTNFSIRSDLPKAVHVERAILASKAYNLKQNHEVTDTNIREKGISVWLEVKYPKEDKWVKLKN